ncbi:hypothetical protein FALBO_5165 [Fusarium albosuccineum]|uniref:Uncharacterized protein n=1 Tax=Fusarium albosuccineum TaxID=1237068 RepID=A0A8H4LFP9_9HYPO|nr:hypothetical protein FALBO_5165 [Fusarium albosuccineum]
MSSGIDTTDTTKSWSGTATYTATATQLLALTTPFKQPRGCDSHWKQTRILSTEGDTSTVPVLLSTAVPSCYPSGWDHVVSESRWNFSPAVCPSDWTYCNMGEDEAMGGSTAFCCNSGYTRLNDDDWELVARADISTHHCGRWVQNAHEQTTKSDTEAASSINTGRTLMLHGAWSISWNASDTSTLTPKLPSLTGNMEVPTWTPGQDIPDGKYDESPVDDGPFSDGWGRFQLIGIPIIGVSFVVLGVWICMGLD